MRKESKEKEKSFSFGYTCSYLDGYIASFDHGEFFSRSFYVEMSFLERFLREKREKGA